MRFARFISTFIFIALLGFSSAFASSEVEPGDGGNGHRPTGKVFRCFAKIGMAYSTARNTDQWKNHGTYCAAPYPPDNPKGCQKEWTWSLDNKNDSAEETAQSKLCRFKDAWEGGCRNNGGCAWNAGDCHVFVTQGHWNTPQTFSFCAIEYDTSDSKVPNDFEKVSKCVDKIEGKEVSNRSLCDNDKTGNRYYYKPKCADTDDTNQCYQRLKSYNLPYGWRFCYEPTGGGNITSFLPHQGGQTVRFREFLQEDALGWINQRTGPCERTSYTPSGGTPGETTEPISPLKSLVILDREDSKNGQTTSKVHTKISGESYIFKIYAYDDAGKLTTSIEKLTCDITNPDGNVFSASGQSDTAIRALLRSGGTFRFPADSSYKTEISGKYNIKCTGTDKNGKEVSASTDFFTAPYAYQYSQINAIFQNSTYSQSSNGEVAENLLNAKDEKGGAVKLPLTLEYATKDGVIKTLTHDNKNWARKPVVKIGADLKVNMSLVEAKNKDGNTDTGVDSTKNSNLGLLQATNYQAKINSVANGDNVPPASSQSGTCGNIVPNFPTTATAIEMTDGKSNDINSIATINEHNSMLVTGSVDIYDFALYDKIRDEKNANKCGDQSAFPCPYPTILRLNLEYEIVPANFIIEALNDDGNPVKVLYFGMGNTPEVEATTKLRITALNTANLAQIKTGDTTNRDLITAKNFSSGCAAQNMLLNMDGMKGSGFSITILNKDGKPYEIKSTDFKNGVADTDVIIKVEKDKDNPFRPNMKSEPIFIGDSNADGIPAKMEFAKFAPAATYYPRYDDARLNPNLPMLILRARINAIDTDNGSGNIGNLAPTKVWYEFQCEYCNIEKVAEITGWNNGKGYTNADRSPTQQGWWIDRTFSENNNNKIAQQIPRIESTNSNSNIRSVSDLTQGLQEISYQNLSAGTHKLNILHGAYTQNNQPIAMPEFLLYNAYWQDSGVQWNTSSFIYVRGNADDEKRNYGVDTGGAKNTRSGGRTGKF